MDSPDILEMDNLESNNESIDAPLVSPFLDSDDELGDGEVLNELDEYGNAGSFYLNKIIISIDGDDLAFSCMIGFRKFVAYCDPFLPINIITHKAYNTIMVERLENTERNLVAIVRDVVMGRPFRAVTQLEYDYVKGLISFTRIFYTYIFRMPCTIPRLKNFEWSKVPPILILCQWDLMSGLKYSHEKNKLMCKNCLNLGPEYQVDEDRKEWLTRGLVSMDGVT
ncbi:hypothetical protein Tco_0173144 [Tanacetum coccineum]